MIVHETFIDNDQKPTAVLQRFQAASRACMGNDQISIFVKCFPRIPAHIVETRDFNWNILNFWRLNGFKIRFYLSLATYRSGSMLNVNLFIAELC